MGSSLPAPPAPYCPARSALLPALLPTLRARPFALFGHSAGSWVAYQLARELKTRGGPLPLKLYASANRSPTLAGDRGARSFMPPARVQSTLAAGFLLPILSFQGPFTAHP